MSEPLSLFKHIFILRSGSCLSIPCSVSSLAVYGWQLYRHGVGMPSKKKAQRGPLQSGKGQGREGLPSLDLSLKWDTVLSQPWRQHQQSKPGTQACQKWVDWGNSQIQNSLFMESLALGNMLFTKIYLQGTNSELWFVSWLQKIIPVRAESLYVQQLWGALKVGTERKRHKTATEL